MTFQTGAPVAPAAAAAAQQSPFQQPQQGAPAAPAAPGVAASPFQQAQTGAQAPAAPQQGGFGAGGSFGAGAPTTGATGAGEATETHSAYVAPNTGLKLAVASETPRPNRPFRKRADHERTKLVNYDGQVVVIDDIRPVTIPDKMNKSVPDAKKTVGGGNLFVYFPEAVDPNTGQPGVWQPWPNQLFMNTAVIELIVNSHASGATTVAGVVRKYADREGACSLIALDEAQAGLVNAILPAIEGTRAQYYEDQFEPETPQQ